MEANLAANSTIHNIRLYVRLERPEIVVAKEQLEIAEKEFMNLQKEGKIVFAEFRPAWSYDGKLSFLMHYPCQTKRP